MKASNYGELLSFVLKMPLLAYKEYGSYQGDYLAVLDAGKEVQIWKGIYGSCSGCDWLEAERDYANDEISDVAAKEYVKDDKPFLVIPKTTMRKLTLEKFKGLLPRNTRNEFDDNLFYDISLQDCFDLVNSSK